MNPETTKNARLSVFCFASVGVLTNLLTLSSGDLLRYNGGGLGLMKYTDANTGQTNDFIGLEDSALEVGRTAGVSAFLFGLTYLCVLSIHYFVTRIQCSDILLGMLGAVIQLCLLVVYIAKDNGICEVEGCSWGSGAAWLLISEVMMLSASIGSIYTARVCKLLAQHAFKKTGLQLQNLPAPRFNAIFTEGLQTILFEDLPTFLRPITTTKEIE